MSGTSGARAAGAAAGTEARVALVTGAGQRVGRAIAEYVAARGWRVAVHYHRSQAGAAETVQAIRALGGDADAFQADLTTPATFAPLVQNVVQRFGRLDLLVNSAAGMERTPFGGITADAFDAVIALNLRAPFLLAQAVAPVLAEGGSIVNIADHMGEEPWPDYSVHGIAKAAVQAMTRHVAAALAPRVRVNAVAPGWVLSPPGMDPVVGERFAAETPLRRLGSPMDVAEAVHYFANARYVTGETLFVDGGRHGTGHSR